MQKGVMNIIMKKVAVLFLLSVLIFSFGASVACFAAEADESAVAAPSSSPFYNRDGDEILFEAEPDSTTNSPTSIFLMVGFLAICLLLCLDSVRSFIKNSRKRRAEMFDPDKINKD